MIFCVEDDSSIRELMLYALRASGFQTTGFGTAEEFWNALKNGRPELVLLDIMLPDEDGISILKNLRSFVMTADIPVIMASAKGTEFDKVIGLDLGADDYLAKPFGMMEMVSRVKAVLRRTNHLHNAPVLTCKVIDSRKALAAENGIRLVLEGTSATVRGIPELVVDILCNLCDNAIKYNCQGGSVTVTAAKNSS